MTSYGVNVFIGALISNGHVKVYTDWAGLVNCTPSVAHFGEPRLGELINLVLARAFRRFRSAVTVVHIRYPPVAIAAGCPQDFAAPGGHQLHTGPNRIGIQVGLALVEELQFTRQVNA